VINHPDQSFRRRRKIRRKRRSGSAHFGFGVRNSAKNVTQINKISGP
jgi:hypothetical protein